MKKTVAVIGAGNGGQAMAAYFAMAGWEVRIFDYFDKPIQAIKQKGYIELTGAVEGRGSIALTSKVQIQIFRSLACSPQKISAHLAHHVVKEGRTIRYDIAGETHDFLSSSD